MIKKDISEDKADFGEAFHKRFFKFTIVYGIPLAILLYVLYFNFLPFGFEKTYTIDVGAIGDDDNENILFVDGATFSPRQSYGNNQFRESRYVNRPVFIYFNPKAILNKNSSIDFSMDYEIDGKLFFEIFNTNSNATEWRLFNNPGYVEIKEFDDKEILVRKEWIIGKCEELKLASNCSDFRNFDYLDVFDNKIDNFDEWFNKNIPKHTSIEFQSLIKNKDNLDYINKDINYIENSHTEINTALRGTLTFLVYLKDKLDLEITKEDLDWYDGEDKVLFELKNMEGELIYSSTIEDGLNVKNFKTNLPKEGIYILNFIALQKNEIESKPIDYLIKKIKINTNRIISKGIIRSHMPERYYTISSEPSKIKIRLGLSEEQEIVVSNNDLQEEYHIDKRFTNHWYDINLKIGINEIKTETGYVDLDNVFLAFYPENYFDPYDYYLDKVPSFIIRPNLQLIKEENLPKNENGEYYFKFKSEQPFKIHKLELEIRK